MSGINSEPEERVMRSVRKKRLVKAVVGAIEDRE